MINCPKCTSSQYSSNELDGPEFHKVAHAMHAAHRTGHPAMMIGAGLFYGAVKVANHFRAKWKCDHCGTTFD